MFFEMHACILCFIRLLKTTLNLLCMFLPMLGGYQNFLALVESSFHKIIYKKIWFHF
jgi:hypothetical protein